VVEREGRYGKFLGCSKFRDPGVGCQAAWDQFGNRLPGHAIDPTSWGQPGYRAPRRGGGCLLSIVLLVACAAVAATAIAITLA